MTRSCGADTVTGDVTSGTRVQWTSSSSMTPRIARATSRSL
ncbi:hypothetical protein SMICM304S_09643 [Streptomyces microflavus]